MTKLRLTGLQMFILVMVWPRLKRQPPPNCGELLKTVREHPVGRKTPSHEARGIKQGGWIWSDLSGPLRSMARKGIVRLWYGPRNQTLWAPGPVSDLLQELGVLSS